MSNLTTLDDAADGEVVAHNTLWKSGQHTHFDFFRLHHRTDKGNWMGTRLSRHVVKVVDNGKVVRVGEPVERKLRRLPRQMYQRVADVDSVFEEDCGYM